MNPMAASYGPGERPSYLSAAFAFSVATHVALIWISSSYGSLDLLFASKAKEPNQARVLNVVLPAQQEASASSNSTQSVQPVMQDAQSVLDRQPPATDQTQVSAMEEQTGESVGLAISTSRYYPVSELDEHPGIVITPELDQLVLNGPVGLNGHAKIELLVESDGRINEANILETNLPAPYPDGLRQAFTKVQYSPGRLHGRDVRMRIIIAVEYVDGISSLPSHRIEDGRVRLEALPQVPVSLMPDRHQRKQNPPRQP